MIISFAILPPWAHIGFSYATLFNPEASQHGNNSAPCMGFRVSVWLYQTGRYVLVV